MEEKKVHLHSGESVPIKIIHMIKRRVFVIHHNNMVLSFFSRSSSLTWVVVLLLSSVFLLRLKDETKEACLVGKGPLLVVVPSEKNKNYSRSVPAPVVPTSPTQKKDDPVVPTTTISNTSSTQKTDDPVVPTSSTQKKDEESLGAVSTTTSSTWSSSGHKFKLFVERLSLVNIDQHPPGENIDQHPSGENIDQHPPGEAYKIRIPDPFHRPEGDTHLVFVRNVCVSRETPGRIHVLPRPRVSSRTTKHNKIFALTDGICVDKLPIDLEDFVVFLWNVTAQNISNTSEGRVEVARCRSASETWSSAFERFWMPTGVSVSGIVAKDLANKEPNDVVARKKGSRFEGFFDDEEDIVVESGGGDRGGGGGTSTTTLTLPPTPILFAAPNWIGQYYHTFSDNVVWFVVTRYILRTAEVVDNYYKSSSSTARFPWSSLRVLAPVLTTAQADYPQVSDHVRKTARCMGVDLDVYALRLCCNKVKLC